MAQTVSPALAAKAGNRAQLNVAKTTDPVFLALTRWNNELVLSGTTPTGSEDPVQDDRAYTVEGAAQPFCRPKLKVAWRAGFQPGPEVRFEQRDDAMHLTVVFEEDHTARVSGAMPFDVKVKSVKLSYGADPSDVLDFPEPLQEPLDPQKGPAFRIECDAVVPLDDRRARIVAALQTRMAAQWIVSTEFEWVRILPTQPQPQPDPRGPHGGVVVRPRPDGVIIRDHRRPDAVVIRDHRLRPEITRRAPQDEVSDTGAAMRAEVVMARRPEVLREILVAPIIALPQPQTQVVTFTIERRLTAEYPKDSQENRPIFAGVTGDYVQIGWKNTAHGWFQPTPIQDTVYCLPHAYRLQVDEATGLPSMQAVLLRKADSGEMVDTLDPKHYKVRLTLKARPDFDAARLGALRALIRAESTNTVKYADLVLGGYASARFIPDPALAGLGELFAGSTAGTRETIDPAEGFTLTYEGNAEFIDLLFQRLVGEGIEGVVELDLMEPGGTTRKQPVPVVLTLRRLAPLALPWVFETPPEPPEPPEGTTPNPMVLLPRDVTFSNPTGVEVTLGGLSAHALQKSPVTGRVDEWYVAKGDGVWPATLAPGEQRAVRLSVEAEDPLYNAWDIALLDCRTKSSQELVLSQIFDAATGGVRGWKIDIECPPLAFFDQLSAEDQAMMRDIVAIEVEVRRLGSSSIEEVRLTRQAPRGNVLLSRTVADFVSDRATGRSTFEYRQRILRMTRADVWTAWRQETGSAVSVFLS